MRIFDHKKKTRPKKNIDKNKTNQVNCVFKLNKLLMKKIAFKLDKDYYAAKMIGKNITFHRILMIKNDPLWKWEGVLHESLTHPNQVKGSILEGVINEYNHVPGARSSDPDKWRKDINILENALQKDPNNGRYAFYLAQSYAVLGEWEKALKQYQIRVAMGEKASREEMFWSLYCIACLQSDLQKPHEFVIDSFLTAFHYDPSRAEPLYRLAVQFQLMESYILGYLVAKEAFELPMPKKALKIQHAIYDYLLHLKLAELSCQIGNREESLSHYQALANNPKTPAKIQEIIQTNIKILSEAP